MYLSDNILALVQLVGCGIQPIETSPELMLNNVEIIMLRLIHGNWVQPHRCRVHVA